MLNDEKWKDIESCVDRAQKIIENGRESVDAIVILVSDGTHMDFIGAGTINTHMGLLRSASLDLLKKYMEQHS